MNILKMNISAKAALLDRKLRMLEGYRRNRPAIMTPRRPVRVIGALVGRARREALKFVNTASRGRQGEAQALLALVKLVQRLRRRRPRLAPLLEPCLNSALRKRSAGEPFNCKLGESAACAVCRLETQMALSAWVAERLAGETSDIWAYTLTPEKWRAPPGSLGGNLDLVAERRAITSALAEYGSQVWLFGAFDFSVHVPHEQARLWEPHIHFIAAGSHARASLEMLAERYGEISVEGRSLKRVTNVKVWAAYLFKGYGQRRVRKRDRGLMGVGKEALRAQEETELTEFLVEKSVSDLIVRYPERSTRYPSEVDCF